jgi:membrane associated rhomboid family serine protease
MDDETEDRVHTEDEWLAIQPCRVKPAFRRGLNRQKVKLWALVLDSRGVPCCLAQHGDELELLVPSWHLERAYEELSRFEENNINWPSPLPPPRPLIENALATISILILLATFHNITRLDLSTVDGLPVEWFRLGNADAVRILDGEWWRLITALTLHNDVVHLLSNLAIGGVFVFLLCRELGSGLAWTLLLAAGSAGNLFNAVIQSGRHNSVGASTAVFGAVGILAALSLVRYRHHLQRRWALPAAAALALLAVLGTEGENTDLGAHLFGFLSGILLGYVAENVIARHGLPGSWLNAILAMLCAVVVVTAWLAALAAG